MDANTRLIDLTVGELMTIVANQLKANKEDLCLRLESKLNHESREEEGPFYGIAGIAKALHCSNSTAQRMKNAHMLDGGFIQYGAKIIVKDAQALREIAGMAKAKKNKKHIV